MSRTIDLPPSEVHLWLAFYDGAGEKGVHSAYRELLTAAERKQELRFYFERDRRRYLVTRALVRTVLSRYAPVGPRDWTFSANAYGRPEIANVPARDPGLVFNISHTDGLIVLGVGRDRDLGVDVENCQAREVSADIADCYFAPEEVAALKAVAPDRQRYRFFEYWTFKESYIKARGMGLSLPLDKFSFRYPDDGAVEILIHPELGDDAARWQFWQFQPTPEHLVAVCAGRTGIECCRPIVRQVVPMVSEKIILPEFLRVSDQDEKQRSTTGESDDCFCISRSGFTETRHGSGPVR